MKKIFAFFLVFVLLFSLCSINAYADPMTLSQIASLGYAIGSSFGLDFSMQGLTSAGINSYLEGKINRWLEGRSVIEVFGADQARIVAGKLIVPAMLYNGIRNFLNDFISENDIKEDSKVITLYSGGNSYLYGGLQSYYISETTLNERPVYFVNSNIVYGSGWGKASIYTGYFYGFYISNNKVFGRYVRLRNGQFIANVNTELGTAGETQSTVSVSLDGDVPDVINPDKEWSGTVGEQDWPDTNLEDLLGEIDQMVLDGDLIVEGEIVDPVVPPTPVPTYPPVDDILPGINTGIEIGNDLIIGQQAQTGAITQGLEGVQEAIGSLEGTVEAIVDTPMSEELPDFKFDLRELFPFCIPFDIYRLLSSFDSEPAAPHVQLPIVIDSINFRYNLDLDFSAWDPVAQAMRTVELIVYAIALAWATGKVIKW